MLQNKISIALCTYNGEKYLQSQLDSYVSQSLHPDELIVCDDCSTDGTLNIIRNFSENAPFVVKFYVNEFNIGSTKNFEKAISLCSGDLIFLSDQDDIWVQEKISIINEIFLRNSEIGLVFSDADVVDENLNSMGYNLWESVGFKIFHQEKILSGCATDILLKQNFVTGATMAFRHQFIKNFVPISKSWVHDGWITFFIASCSKLSFVPQSLILYRQHSGNQIGGRKKGILQKISNCKNNGSNSYLIIANQYFDLLNSMKNFGGKSILFEISNKIEHLNARSKMDRGFFERISTVFKELVGRRYHKYSGGWISAFKDIFFRL